MRDFEEELSDVAGPRFALALAGVEQFSSGKQPRTLVVTVERSDRLDWLQQKVSTAAHNCGIEVESEETAYGLTFCPTQSRGRPWS